MLSLIFLLTTVTGRHISHRSLTEIYCIVYHDQSVWHSNGRCKGWTKSKELNLFQELKLLCLDETKIRTRLLRTKFLKTFTVPEIPQTVRHTSDKVLVSFAKFSWITKINGRIRTTPTKWTSSNQNGNKSLHICITCTPQKPHKIHTWWY